MVKVRALIKLFKKGRKTPFISGYRPLFSFINEMKTSGHISLIEKEEFYPGDVGEVQISFLNKKYLGDDFGIGKKITFSEGLDSLGEGEIIEVYYE